MTFTLIQIEVGGGASSALALLPLEERGNPPWQGIVIPGGRLRGTEQTCLLGGLGLLYVPIPDWEGLSEFTDLLQDCLNHQPDLFDLCPI